MKEGVHRAWYRNGQLSSSGNYNRNLCDGRWVWCHENGQINEEGVFVEGAKTGDWHTFFPNGQPKSMGLYRNGLEQGYWAFFSDDEGTLDPEKSGIYVDGERLPDGSQ